MVIIIIDDRRRTKRNKIEMASLTWHHLNLNKSNVYKTICFRRTTRSFVISMVCLFTLNIINSMGRIHSHSHFASSKTGGGGGVFESTGGEQHRGLPDEEQVARTRKGTNCLCVLFLDAEPARQQAMAYRTHTHKPAN